MDLKQEIKLSDLIPSGLRLKRTPRESAKATLERHRPMPKELVGLKIDSTGLSAAHVVNGDERQLLRVAHSDLPKGVVSAGEVRDPVALGQALGQFFSVNGLPRRGVRLGLGNSRIGVRLIEVPAGGDPQQLENMIRFRAHEMLSASLDEAVIDYHDVGESTDAEGNPVKRIVLVVAYRDSIDRYLTATDAAQLDVVGIDLEAFALLRAAAPPADETSPKTALAAISIDAERTTLAISDGVVCHFTRVLDWGDARIDAAVARGLSVPAPEAAAIWRGLKPQTDEAPADEGKEAKEAPDPTVVRGLVAHELQTLSRDLQSSLRFYQSQPGAIPVEAVHASGALTDVPIATEELARQLDVRLEIIDPLLRFAVADSGTQLERHGNLTVALGLGIED